MKFLTALVLCQLAASSFGILLFSFNKVKYLNNKFEVKLPSGYGSERKLSPIILVPGDGGSRLDATLDKTSVVNDACYLKTDMFYDIWLNKLQLIPGEIDCWADNLRMTFDAASGQVSNSPGVTIRVPGWGYSETVEWIDTSHASVGAYYVNTADALVKAGYRRGFSIRSAPYDFRKSPNENDFFPIRMRKLVEETYELNNNTRVTLIVHSYGGPMTLHFLQQQTQAWKDKYVRRMISLAGAWGGSMKSLKTYITGEDFNSWLIDPEATRTMLKSTPSMAYLMPNPVFWKSDQVLVSTSKRSYTVADIKAFYDDINFPEGWEMYKNVQPYARDFTAPGVDVHCFYGSGQETVERLDYSGSDIDDSPTIVNGNGDGTVNAHSLAACRLWEGQQTQLVQYKEYPGNDHMGILSNQTVLQDLIKILTLDE